MSCWTKEQLEGMLEDVINELELSEEMVEEHGPIGTSPAKMVRLVLDQKDRQISALQAGLKIINHHRPVAEGSVTGRRSDTR